MTHPPSNALPVVSFGLPVRNGAPTIAQAIESVMFQMLENWELVISDNRSTDGTSEIGASFAARDERIRHVMPDHDLSIHENFRKTFHHARGVYFRWHGDDDWLEPQYAERTIASRAACRYQSTASLARPPRSKWTAICPLTEAASGWPSTNASATAQWLRRRAAVLRASYTASRILP